MIAFLHVKISLKYLRKFFLEVAPRCERVWVIHILWSSSGFDTRKVLPFGGHREEQFFEGNGTAGGLFVEKNTR
jgi:hypothetical protein